MGGFARVSEIFLAPVGASRFGLHFRARLTGRTETWPANYHPKDTRSRLSSPSERNLALSSPSELNLAPSSPLKLNLRLRGPSELILRPKTLKITKIHQIPRIFPHFPRFYRSVSPRRALTGFPARISQKYQGSQGSLVVENGRGKRVRSVILEFPGSSSGGF